MNASINYVAVVAATVLAYAFGFLWYNVLFREPYSADLSRTKEWMDAGPSLLAASVMQVGGNIVAAFVLDWLIERTNSDGALGGAKIAFLTWLVFASIIGPMYAFQAYSLRFFAIVAGGWLITLVGMGAILGSWRK